MAKVKRFLIVHLSWAPPVQQQVWGPLGEDAGISEEIASCSALHFVDSGLKPKGLAVPEPLRYLILEVKWGRCPFPAQVNDECSKVCAAWPHPQLPVTEGTKKMQRPADCCHLYDCGSNKGYLLVSACDNRLP